MSAFTGGGPRVTIFPSCRSFSPRITSPRTTRLGRALARSCFAPTVSTSSERRCQRFCVRVGGWGWGGAGRGADWGGGGHGGGPPGALSRDLPGRSLGGVGTICRRRVQGARPGRGALGPPGRQGLEACGSLGRLMRPERGEP